VLLEFLLGRLDLSTRHDHVKEHLRVLRGQSRLLLWRHLLHLVLQVYQVKTGKAQSLRDVLGSRDWQLGGIGHHLAWWEGAHYLNGDWGFRQEIIMDCFQNVYN
jgi:hypothetical protein